MDSTGDICNSINHVRVAAISAVSRAAYVKVKLWSFIAQDGNLSAVNYTTKVIIRV